MTIPESSASGSSGFLVFHSATMRLQLVFSAAYTGSSSGGHGLHSPTSTLSDPPPPAKKRRISYSSSSSLSDDEERPLADMLAANKKPSPPSAPNGKSHGRGKKSKGTTAPVTLPVPTEKEKAQMEHPVANGHDPKVKVEDAMDEGQLNRLVTGVTVDATAASNTAVCLICQLFLCASVADICSPLLPIAS